MARYAEAADLYTLGAPETGFDGVAPEAIEVGLSAACDVVDSYLSGRFVLPLLTAGSDIKRAVCIIAAYDLIMGRGFNSQNAGGDSEQLADRYEKVTTWLRDIAKGDVTPVVTDSAPPTSGGGTSTNGAVDQYVVAPRIVCGEFTVGAPRPRGW